MLNADASGTTLVFATWDEALFADRSRRAYAGERFPDERFFQETTSTIMRVRAGTGEAQEVLRAYEFWINHVLIHPRIPDRIEFCHESSGRPDRMWRLDVKSGVSYPLRGQAPGDWYEHEFWNAAGDRVYFHGGSSTDDDSGICGWCTPDGTAYQHFQHRTPGRAYGHYNLHPAGVSMVTDGEAGPGCISKVHLRAGRQEFEVLCRHDSYRFGDDQRCHPHPSFTPDGRQVVFTSNRAGSSNVYLCDWD